VLAGVLVVVALGALGCTTSVAEPVAIGSGSKVTVRAVEMAFQPKEVRVSVNRPVTLSLENRGKLLHDWTVEQIAVTAVNASGSADHGMGSHDAGTAGMMGGMMSGGGMAGHSTSVNVAEPQLHVASEAGHTAQIAFTPSQPGTYVFYCTVPGHRQAGMEGRLVVE